MVFQLAVLGLVATAAARGIYGHHGYAVGYAAAYPLADHVPAAVNGLQPTAAAGAAVPLDTPSVVAARAHHFHAKAAQYALVGPGPYYDHGGYYGGHH